MAQKVQTIFVSDLSGEELGEDGQNVKFGFLRAEYEIDLSQQEADDFANTIQKYVAAGRRVGGRRRGKASDDPSASTLSRRHKMPPGLPTSSPGSVPML